MPALFVHVHLRRLEIVQLLSDGCLVLGSESGPRFVRSSVVFMTRGNFDVVVEFYYLWRIAIKTGEKMCMIAKPVECLCAVEFFASSPRKILPQNFEKVLQSFLFF